MESPRLTRLVPDWKNAVLAVLSAILLVLAFPDFEISFLASIGLVPLIWAIERQKESGGKAFVLGWLWGFVFFTATCWWLTFAPITYAGFPTWLAYMLLLCVTAVVAIFPGIFAVLMSVLLKRLGAFAVFASPVVWVFTEFLRYWLTGNNWNAIGYSQFNSPGTLAAAALGGVLLCSAAVVTVN